MSIFFGILSSSLRSFACILLVLLPCWAQTSTTAITEVADNSTALCGYPGKPVNGNVNPSKDVYKEGDTVTYDCEIGHKIRGVEKRVCLWNGTWSGQLPVCLDAIKVDPKSVIGSKGTDGNAIHLFDRNSQTCISTNKSRTLHWKIELDQPYHIVAITLVPGKPEDGKIELKISAYGGKERPWAVVDKYDYQTAPLGFTYRIKDGEMIARKTIEVEDTISTRSTFSMCEILIWALESIPNCGEPEIPINSSVIYSHDRKTAFYKCNSGFEPIGNITRTCQVNGIWSGQEIKCTPYQMNSVLPANERVQCGEPAVARHSKIAYSQDRRTVFYFCDSGYEPVGNPVRNCQDNGEWSGIEIVCVKNQSDSLKIQQDKVGQTAALSSTDEGSKSNEGIWKGAAITAIGLFILTLAVFVGITIFKRRRYAYDYRYRQSSLGQSSELGKADGDKDFYVSYTNRNQALLP